MGVALWSIMLDGQVMSTIEFKINYISPAFLKDGILKASAQVVSKKKSHAVVECRATVGDRYFISSLF
jgi:acyl-coenzyme A thioesterase PaaI-like protein